MNSFETAKRAFGTTSREDDDIYINHGIYGLENNASKCIIDDEIKLT
jgi:hypothetical protein